MPMNPRLLRPTVSGFDPRRIAGLVGWFDGSQVAAGDLDTNGNVETWRNLGSGGNATNTTPNNRPTLTTGALNGRSVLTFDGSNDLLTWSAPTLASASLFAVFKNNVPASGLQNQTIFGAGNNASQNGAVVNIIKNDNGASVLSFAVGGFTVGTQRVLYTWLAGGYGAGNGLDYGPNVVSLRWASTGAVATENGAQIATLSAPGSLQPAFFGASRTPDNFLNGYIAEILIYDNQLSAAQASVVERYLGKKWGVTVA
jgi:hypothetical protein